MSEPFATARISCGAGTVAALNQLADAALPNETGGLLVGYRHEDGTVTVTRAIEVPDPEATPTRYVQRHSVASRILEHFLSQQEPDTVEGYVGNWHTHPAPVGSSLTDLETLARHAVLDGAAVALLTLMRAGEAWLADWYVAKATPSGRRQKVIVKQVEVAHG